MLTVLKVNVNYNYNVLKDFVENFFFTLLSCDFLIFFHINISYLTSRNFYIYKISKNLFQAKK